jgi:hypothetical protein
MLLQMDRLMSHDHLGNIYCVVQCVVHCRLCLSDALLTAMCRGIHSGRQGREHLLSQYLRIPEGTRVTPV